MRNEITISRRLTNDTDGLNFVDINYVHQLADIFAMLRHCVSRQQRSFLNNPAVPYLIPDTELNRNGKSAFWWLQTGPGAVQQQR
jgi:hypothetical protein